MAKRQVLEKRRHIQGIEDLAVRPGERWYAIMTKHGMEKMANIQLFNQGYRCWYPHYVKETRRGRRLAKVERPLFPRYVFAGVAPGKPVGPMFNTVGVSTVVHDCTGPIEVPDFVMAPLLAIGNVEGYVETDGKDPHCTFRVGQAVRISGGSFTGFNAIIETVIERSERIRLWIDALGRKVPLETSMAQIEHL